ncbi:thioesterase family protein [Actinocorallia longicatena]|uniref:Thioesterase family protein n=1 Tax=Actinocorallia longicatena TaxID=111803 RepID=A0ABP6QHB5_9ACTN
MISEFERATASTLVDGVATAEIADSWGTGGPAPNGGYLLALVTRALGRVSAHPHPMTVTAHYLRPAAPGPATITTEVIRSGRTLTSAQASLFQDGKERIRVLAGFGDLESLPDDVRTSAEPPVLPQVEDCFEAPDSFKRLVTLLGHADLRVDPATAGWAAGAPSGRGEMRSWFRLADGQEPDPCTLLFAVDALPPVAFEMGVQGWVPTLELTVHVRALPAPGWLRVVASTRNLAGGHLEEDVEIWDSKDRLVAQSRQLARVVGP